MKHNIDSNEEQFFIWWLDELVEAGYVIDYTDAKSYELSNKIEYYFTETKKTKIVEKYQPLVQPHIYTPDFEIKWHKSALNIFVNEPITAIIFENDSIVIRNTQLAKLNKDLFIKCGEAMLVEIKGNFNRFSGEKENAINRKWLFEKHHIYTNLVKVPDIFKKTFTPKKYLKTPTGKTKLINFEVRTLEEFLKTKKK
jgi:hypothetical protein